MDQALNRLRAVIIREGHACGSCGEDLEPEDEVFLLQVVRVHRAQVEGNWVLQFTYVLDPHGDFDSVPYFFHGECFGEDHDSLRELVEDSTPAVTGDPVCHCSFCGSEIGEGFLMGVAHMSELVLSERQPNRQDALDVELDERNPTYFCVGCLNEFNINVVEGLWPEDGTIAFHQDD